ncbi:uncharacterized protein LOC115093210 isoform X2 [Rhinatrema bivittatum]|uniref:uncharacterized protein LOC115093210 isoform X2 n=1 Tax=Rhinatrema bivittatum TaxID=194408 RepID=UPI00112C37FB|nr:uncharacterized protein LOC115093210 isoform X2 [Rhinatrema bivittatum]
MLMGSSHCIRQEQEVLGVSQHGPWVGVGVQCQLDSGRKCLEEEWNGILQASTGRKGGRVQGNAKGNIKRVLGAGIAASLFVIAGTEEQAYPGTSSSEDWWERQKEYTGRDRQQAGFHDGGSWEAARTRPPGVEEGNALVKVPHIHKSFIKIRMRKVCRSQKDNQKNVCKLDLFDIGMSSEPSIIFKMPGGQNARSDWGADWFCFRSQMSESSPRKTRKRISYAVFEARNVHSVEVYLLAAWISTPENPAKQWWWSFFLGQGNIEFMNYHLETRVKGTTVLGVFLYEEKIIQGLCLWIPSYHHFDTRQARRRH